MPEEAGDIIEGAVDAITDPGTLVAAGVAYIFGGPVAAGRVLLTAAVSGAVNNALAPDIPSSQGLDASSLNGRNLQFRAPSASREIVYGEVKTSGPIVFVGTTENKNHLHLVIALSGAEISSVSEMYFNDKLVRGGGTIGDGTVENLNNNLRPDYNSQTDFTVHFGKDNQTADSNLVSRIGGWTNNHRLRGIAYVYVRMKYDPDVFATGIPNISLKLRGKPLYDPRTGSTSYSSNPALVIRDYLTNDRYGLGIPSSDIDDVSFNAAANVCEETVTKKNASTADRYTCNGTVDTSKTPRAILQDLLTSCSGQLIYSGGKFKLLAGEYRTPTKTLDEDDLRGGIQLQTKNSGQDQFNAVKGVFIDPGQNYVPTDYPPTRSATFRAEDNNIERFLDITLPYTIDASEAQRLSKIALYRTRQQLTLSMPCKLTAFDLDVGDTVNVTNARLGFNAKPFEVISWTYAYGEGGTVLGVDLVVREISSTVYDFDPNVDEEEFTTDNTDLPNPADIAAPGVTVSDELQVRNEEVITALIVDVSSNDGFFDTFEVQAKRASESRYINLGRAAGNRFELLNVIDGEDYDVRARVVTSFGFRSPYKTTSHQVVGKTAVPSDVTGLAGNLIGNQYLLTWDAIPDLDLSYYRIRYAESTTAEYRESISLVPKVSRPGTSVFVPARNGKYFVKAVDKLGLASANAATIVLDTNIDGLNNLNVVETINEHPDFPGTFDDVVEVDEEDRLILDTSLQFDDVTGNFDDAQGLFDAGFGNLYSEGFYYFGNSADLGAVYLNHVTAKIKHVRVDYVNLFDTAQGLFDERSGLFDGDPNAFDDTNAELQIRTTQDDPTGTPTWSDWQPFTVGDYRFWGAEFRVKMTTVDPDATPAVSELTVTIDMPDRTEAEQDLETSSGVKVVTFPTAFNATPAIGIGAQDMQTGDFYEISSKSRTGFTITFKQSSGAVVSTERTFDYVAKGYGYEVT